MSGPYYPDCEKIQNDCRSDVEQLEEGGKTEDAKKLQELCEKRVKNCEEAHRLDEEIDGLRPKKSTTVEQLVVALLTLIGVYWVLRQQQEGSQ